MELSMIPARIEDPRDNLEKATRWELYEYAKQVGCKEVYEPMPAMLAIQILRARGFTNIRIPDRPLGSIAILGAMPRGVAEPPATQTLDALAELKKQFETQQAAPKELTFQQMRIELKARGIKYKRTDKVDTLRELLDG